MVNASVPDSTLRLEHANHATWAGASVEHVAFTSSCDTRVAQPPSAVGNLPIEKYLHVETRHAASEKITILCSLQGVL
jgi:hypothetical protein